MSHTYAIVLAAGKGTRMKSKVYKVLHKVCGHSMVHYVTSAAKEAGVEEAVVVVGHGAESVKQHLGPKYTYVIQEEQLGTGHAVMMAKHVLENKKGHTLILCGDTPLVTGGTLSKFMEVHKASQASVSILTTIMDNPTGYGRIVRDETGAVLKIVEQKDATEEEQNIQEINTGIFCFDNERLMHALTKITNDNAQGEYYLTDCIEILQKEGDHIGAYLTADSDEAMGVNDRVALALAEKRMRARINEAHMRNGVTIIDPDHTYIEPNVSIGQDTIIHPGAIITGHSIIEEDCVVGPNSHLENVHIEQGVTVEHSKIVDSKVGRETMVGPFAYIRPGSNIGANCKIGDFVEVKNSQIGDGSKIPHLSYVGDATIGSKVNMGCGSITVNYDGQKKHQTIVEDNSFVGCNVNLVAPVTIGKGAYIAAGSTITDSVPRDSLAIARQRQTTKENYVNQSKNK